MGTDIDEQTETAQFTVKTSETSSNDDPPKRQTWASQMDFIVSAIGCAVGLGNIWRFPYLCYKNGGGAFLVPYIISVLCVGAPVLILEISLGQYMSSGVVRAWQISPAFQGIGMASQLVLFWVNNYYIIVLAWGVYYLGMSFTSALPWASCDNEWNTDRCFTTNRKLGEAANLTTPDNNLTTYGSNLTTSGNISSLVSTTVASNLTAVDSVVEFWERRVLRLSAGIDEPGEIVWGLVVALFIAWVLVYLCVCKGVRWTGKIVYFTALFPYVLLTALLIRGLTLPGAGQGLVFYLKPDFSKLAQSSVWVSAFSQVLFSMCITFGFMVTLGGYNRFHFNSIRNCVVISCVNSATSLYGGLAVFSVLGFMAHEQKVSVADVAESGPGLVFITYPKAVTQMPLSPLWAVLFFFMILLVGLDSQFVSVEGFLTPIIDRYPRVLQRSRNRLVFVALYCAACFLFGLCMMTQGGLYLFQIFDYYSCSGMVLLWICFFEVVVVGWIFGADRFYDALELMMGYRVTPWLKICWKYILPVVSLGMALFYIATFTPLVYNRKYHYPTAAHVFGIGIGLVSMACIPAWFIYSFCRAQGSLRNRWRCITRPMLREHQIADNWKEDGYKWTNCDEPSTEC